VILVGLTGYLVHVGLDAADKLASSIGVVIALTALFAPYLLPPPGSGGAPMSEPDQVEDTGIATATGGGHANTGAQVSDHAGPARVTRSGDAVADGPGSVANTGIQHQAQQQP
jgi:hypothetical protein